MAGAFILLALVAVALLVVSVRVASYGIREERGWLRVGAVLPLVVVLTLSAYLVAKVVYEELYPCWYVDESYCDFTSTQYHDLFGWEF